MVRGHSKYYDETRVKKGLENGTLFKGQLRCCSFAAFVRINGFPCDVFIEKPVHRNRAFHGDLVVIELFPVNLWSRQRKSYQKSNSKTSKSLTTNDFSLWTRTSTTTVSPALLLNDTKENKTKLHENNILAQTAKEYDLQPKGRVVFLQERRRSSIIGTLESFSRGTCMKPCEALLPPFLVANTKYYSSNLLCPEKDSQVYFVTSNFVWDSEISCPVAYDIRPLNFTDLDANLMVILSNSGINTSLITSETMANKERNIPTPHDPPMLTQVTTKNSIFHKNWQIPQEEINVRRDLRNYRTFTIDPSRSTDLDDALHCIAIEDDIYEIGVHIADVSYFLEKDSELDSAAYSQGATYYLGDKVVSMLPSILADNLCSLHPHHDRLTVSVIWKMHSNGTLVENCKPWIGRTIIHSSKRFNYNQVEEIIKIGKLNLIKESLEEDVLNLCQIGICRSNLRVLSGSFLSLMPPVELVFTFNEENYPVKVEKKLDLESHTVIEEFMLLANYLIAEHFVSYKEDSSRHFSFFRNQSKPSSTLESKYKKQFSKFSLNLDSTDQKSFARLLKQYKTQLDPLVFSSLCELASKTIFQARYYVPNEGDNDLEDLYHHSLNMPFYTHFTSPIRRYADVIVHRLLLASLNQISPKESNYSHIELQEIAENCTYGVSRSRKARRDYKYIVLCYFVKANPQQVKAVVVDLHENSLTIYVPNYGLEYNFDLLSWDIEATFNYNTECMTISKERETSLTVSLFSILTVKAFCSDSIEKKVIFELVFD